MKDPIADLGRTGVAPAADARLPVLPPLAALIEIAVVFAVLLALDWLQPGLELLEFRPHPFWFPVLLVSLQYGIVAGLLAATVAIGLTVGAGFPEQTPAQTYFAYLIRIWLEPILWIAAAVLIGQFRMRQIARKQQLASSVAELSNQRSAIADYARNLRSRCNALERQIAARKEPDVLLALKALDTVFVHGAGHGPAVTDAALAQVVNAALPESTASLYIVGDAGLMLVASTGARHAAALPLIATIDPLHSTIVQQGMPVSVLTRDGETRLGGKGIAAVPVLGADHHVVGMLKVDSADGRVLGEALLPALATIARAFAPALEVRTSGHLVAAPADLPAGIGATGLQSHATRLLRQLRWFGGNAPGGPGPPASTPSAPTQIRPASSAKR